MRPRRSVRGRDLGALRGPPLHLLDRRTAGGRPIDVGIRRAVRVLLENGVETTESCEGGDGHPFPEPTVRFCGGHAEGFRALGVALQHGLRVLELRRTWSIQDGEPTGPSWEMTFVRSPALADHAADNAPMVCRWPGGRWGKKRRAISSRR